MADYLHLVGSVAVDDRDLADRLAVRAPRLLHDLDHAAAVDYPTSIRVITGHAKSFHDPSWLKRQLQPDPATVEVIIRAVIQVGRISLADPEPEFLVVGAHVHH